MSGLENRINGHGDSLRWPRDTLYPLKLALTSPTSGGHSVGIVRLRTKATEFSFVLFDIYIWLHQLFHFFSWLSYAAFHSELSMTVTNTDHTVSFSVPCRSGHRLFWLKVFNVGGGFLCSISGYFLKLRNYLFLTSLLMKQSCNHSALSMM
jgi:hypothetical protein